jgi:SP family arabinose:H+ symporter-like MFS transporter
LELSVQRLRQALLSLSRPALLADWEAVAPRYVFSFFAGMMCLQLLWVKTMVPEMKGVPLEELQKELALG